MLVPTSIPPLVARGIDRAYGDRRILTGIDISVPPLARTGLIGENGVGKSTLLRILAGVEAPDVGTVERPRRTGILWREAPVDERATIRELLDGYTAELWAWVSVRHHVGSWPGGRLRHLDLCPLFQVGVPACQATGDRFSSHRGCTFLESSSARRGSSRSASIDRGDAGVDHASPGQRTTGAVSSVHRRVATGLSPRTAYAEMSEGMLSNSAS